MEGWTGTSSSVKLVTPSTRCLPPPGTICASCSPPWPFGLPSSWPQSQRRILLSASTSLTVNDLAVVRHRLILIPGGHGAGPRPLHVHAPVPAPCPHRTTVSNGGT